MRPYFEGIKTAAIVSSDIDLTWEIDSQVKTGVSLPDPIIYLGVSATGVIEVTANVVKFSSDWGDTWTPNTQWSSTVPSQQIMSARVSGADRNVVYLVSYSSSDGFYHFYKSGDGGQTFVEQSSFNDLGFAFSGPGEGMLFVSWNNVDVVGVLSDDVVKISSNGGGSFNTKSSTDYGIRVLLRYFRFAAFDLSDNVYLTYTTFTGIGKLYRGVNPWNVVSEVWNSTSWQAASPPIPSGRIPRITGSNPGVPTYVYGYSTSTPSVSSIFCYSTDSGVTWHTKSITNSLSPDVYNSRFYSFDTSKIYTCVISQGSGQTFIYTLYTSDTFTTANLMSQIILPYITILFNTVAEVENLSDSDTRTAVIINNNNDLYLIDVALTYDIYESLVPFTFDISGNFTNVYTHIASDIPMDPFSLLYTIPVSSKTPGQTYYYCIRASNPAHEQEINEQFLSVTIPSHPIPSGTFTINSDALTTDMHHVTLNTDHIAHMTVGVDTMRFNNYSSDPSDSHWSAWVSYVLAYSWDLIVPGAGSKIVYGEFRNTYGTFSCNHSITAILPSGSFIINDGSTPVSVRDVTLNNSISNAYHMQFSDDGHTSSLMVYAASYYPWALTTGAGDKTVHGIFTNDFGSYTWDATITAVVPSGSFLINNGDPITTTRYVTLDNAIVGDPTNMMFWDSGTTSPTEVYGLTYDWVLTAGNGLKLVNGIFTNYFGPSDPMHATIELDIPYHLASSPYVESTNLYAMGDAWKGDGSTEAYLNCQVVYITPTPGVIPTVRVQYKVNYDAGYSGAIDLTRVKNHYGGDGLVNGLIISNYAGNFPDDLLSFPLAFQGSYGPDPVSHAIVAQYSLDGGPWVDFSNQATPSIIGPTIVDGSLSVDAQIEISSGNIPRKICKSDAVKINFTINDSYEYQIADSGAWVPTSYVTPFAEVSLPYATTWDSPGTKSLKLNAHNGFGTLKSGYINANAVLPYFNKNSENKEIAFVVDRGATIDNYIPRNTVTTTQVGILFNASGIIQTVGDVGYGYCLSNDGVTWTDWVSGDAHYNFITSTAIDWDLITGYSTLEVSYGLKTVYIKLGNSYGTYIKPINVVYSNYVEGPECLGIVIGDGVEVVSSPSVLLGLQALRADYMRIKNETETWESLSDDRWIPYTESYNWTLSPGFGIKTVSVEFKNLIGTSRCSASVTVKQMAVIATITAIGGLEVIDVVWKDMRDMVSDLTGYNIYRTLISGLNYVKVNPDIISVVPTDVSDGIVYHDHDVIVGVMYYYVVTMLIGNNLESGYSNEASATPYMPQKSLDRTFINFLGMDDNVKLYWTSGTLYDSSGVYKIQGNISKLPDPPAQPLDDSAVIVPSIGGMVRQSTTE